MRYRADITAGSLKVAESRVVADLLLKQADDAVWKSALGRDNLLQARSPATAKRLARLIRNRLETMTPDLWRLVRDGSSVVAIRFGLVDGKYSRSFGLRREVCGSDTIPSVRGVPESAAESSPPMVEMMPELHQDPSSFRRKCRPCTLICACIACLLIAVAARHFLFHYASRPLDRSTLYRGGNNAPFITSSDSVIEKMVEVAELSEKDLVYDLGCGDGRIVIGAALAAGCRGIGFDIDPQRVTEARENVRANALENRVEIREQDVFTVDLSNADVAMMYLLPWMMNELVSQFDTMKPGARIVSHTFWIEGVEPDGVFEVRAEKGPRWGGIYVYRTPLRKNPKMGKGKPPTSKDVARPAVGGQR